MATAPQLDTTAAEARAIAKDAYDLRLPAGGQLPHPVFVFRRTAGSPEFKTSWNQIYNNARVYTPDDKAIQTPNSDTPYSFVGADLRAEPLVLTVPAIDKGRYYSLQFIDSTRSTSPTSAAAPPATRPGVFLLAGPSWKGEQAEGHQGGDPVGNRFRLRALSNAAVRRRRHRQGQDDPGRLQGAEPLSAFLGQAGARRRAASRFHRSRSAPRQETTSLAVLRPAELHPAVLSDPSRRSGADGALREDRHRRGQDL